MIRSVNVDTVATTSAGNKGSPEITIAMTNPVEVGAEVWGEWHYTRV